MPSGSCLCGQTKLSYEDEPAMKALCHCTDCQKISGSTYSTNLVIPSKTFKWTGATPKTYEKKADSGKSITSHFCGTCGSTLGRTGDAFPDMVILKAGVLDGGEIEKAKPGAELFSEGRTSWVAKLEGTSDLKAMG